MAGDWKAQPFADLIGGRANVIGGPFGSNLTQADYVDDGVPVVRGNNMGQFGRYIGGEFAYVSERKAKQLAPNQVLPGDIIVTQRGTLGQVS
jgi:type I restriction enzyme S subunit